MLPSNWWIALKNGFLWEKRGARSMAWVGIAHLVLGEDLPPHQAERRLDLSARDFRASVNASVALVICTQDRRHCADRTLNAVGLDPVRNCLVRYPVVQR